MLDLKKKIYLLNKYSNHIKDTGSTEIQIILITFRIDKLNYHLKNNLKDIHNKKGFLQLLEKKNKLLKYLKKRKKNIYKNLLIDLN